MQTGSAGPLGPEDASDPEAKLWWMLGHATPWLASLIWVIVTASSVFGWPWVGMPVVLALVVMIVMQVRHDAQPLCMRCLREQAAGSGQKAQERLFHLWAFHLPPIGPIGKILVTVVVLVGWAIGNIMTGTFLGAIVMIATGGLISYDWYLVHCHRKLKPWCPWCKDPGDDPDQVPERDPDPSMTKRG